MEHDLSDMLWRVASTVHYHVAPVSARESIATRGLVPGGELASGQPQGVYLWDSLDAAHDYLGDKDEPHDLYEVHGAQVEPDPQWGSYGAGISTRPIPAASVRRVR